MSNKKLSYNLYNGEIVLDFDPERHWYYVNGEYVPSVTTVTRYLDKSGPLMWWAVNSTIKFLEATIKPGVIDEIQLKKILEEARKKHQEKKEDAATVGGLIHKWIQEYIEWQLGRGEEPKEPINDQMKLGMQAFLAWSKDHNVKFKETEKKVYSKKYGYAGTIDFIGKVNGKSSVVDFKTGSGPWYEHVLQISAYKEAYEEETKEKLEERWILKIDKEAGTFHAHHATLDEQDFNCFKALLEVYKRHQLGILIKEKPYNKYERTK